ncbi:MAG TPA: DUF222 domain-containing protein [Citricoccus sp.]
MVEQTPPTPGPPAPQPDAAPQPGAGAPPAAVPVGSREWLTRLAESEAGLGTVVGAPVPPGPVPASARDLVALRLALALMDEADQEAEAIDLIRALEQLKAACAAAQARQTRRFERLRRAAEAARGIPAEQRGRGVAAEVGLARGLSPHRGARQLSLARALAEDLPHTRKALSEGTISEDKAAVVHRETAWLPRAQHRAVVDAALADRLPVLGPAQLARETRYLSVGQDPVAAAEQFDTAAADRRVIVRATDHGMATLTAHLPLIQAVACHRALAATAASAVALGEADGRTPAQVMADTLVERLTGQATAAATGVEVHLVMDGATLLAGGPAPARIPGYGSIPAPIARRLLTGGHSAAVDTATTGTGTEAGHAGRSPDQDQARVFLRRLYTAPDTGQLLAMESRRRHFPVGVRRMVVFRDDLCRTPYCDARIQHIDHATDHYTGGATSWSNASGLCARCNYAKQDPGWAHSTTGEHLQVITPTGHRYHHPSAPVLPPVGLRRPRRRPPRDRSRRLPGFTPLHLSLRQLTALLHAG